jgi:hypothetical protein
MDAQTDAQWYHAANSFKWFDVTVYLNSLCIPYFISDYTKSNVAHWAGLQWHGISTDLGGVRINFWTSKFWHTKIDIGYYALYSVVRIGTILFRDRILSNRNIKGLIENKRFWEELTAYFPWYDMDNIENKTIDISYIVVCEFVAAVIFLASRFLATIRGIHIRTHRLMRGIYEVRRWDGPSFRYIHTKFHKDWFRQSKVNREGYSDTQTAWGYHKPTFIFSK